MTGLIPLPVVLPLLGAGACLVLGRSARAQRLISLVVLGSVVVVAAVLLYQAHVDGPQVVALGGWPAELGISLVADRFSALMLLVSSVVTFLVLLYSLGQGVVEYGRDTPLSVYFPTFLVLSAGVSNAFLAGDLFNLYVGFEILLTASFVLITLGGTAARVRAGTTYAVVSLLSSMLFLVALACVYGATGTVNMADVAVRLHTLPEGVRTLLQLLLLLVFSVKAAVFPLSAWLPDSYPTAPAPVTAVFAGLLTKVGVYAIIRTQTLLFPDNPLGSLLLWAALATMLVGILGAVAQSDIKRMLSFTLVSHIGYMVFGVALASELGLTGAIFYVVHHITIQTTLFLVIGLIEIRGGSTAMDRLGGLARAAPLLSVLFFVPAMNLAGIPPFSGFLGKVALVQAGVDDASWLAWLVVAGAIATSLLTLYAIAKTWNRAFWRPRSEAADLPDTDPGVSRGTKSGVRWDTDLLPLDTRLPAGMVLPAAALVAVSCLLTVVAGPLYDVSAAAAAELRDRAVYVSAVLGPDAATSLGERP